MRILLVEPWLTGSHRNWAEGFARSSRNQVEIVGLPGELWRWRLQGGAAALADRVAEQLGDVDVLLVSGLVDVAQLVGLCRRSLDDQTAVVVYQHESQLVYPAPQLDRNAALVNWSSWLVADAVAFNSDFHRQLVGAALPQFLQSMPDDSHVPLLPKVVQRFDVLPLGLDLSWADAVAPRPDSARQPHAPVILWPHRWESDKDPAAFGRALDRLERAGLEFQLILAGDEAPGSQQQRDRLANDHHHRVRAVGPFTVELYRGHLLTADIVVSCAHHEFFGAAMVEAAAAGARIVAPTDLAYREVLGPRFVGYERGHFGSALEAAVAGFRSPTESSEHPDAPAAWVRRYDWRTMAPVYDEYLLNVVSRVRSKR